MEKVALDYESVRPTRAGLAKTALVLGIVGFVMSFLLVGIVPGVAAVVVGLIASHRIRKRPEVYFGVGFARTGIRFGIGACLVSMGIMVLLPSVGGPCSSSRSQCGANLRGIMQSMNVYATDNGDVFPLLPYAPYRVNNAGTLDGTVSAASADDAIKSMYSGAGAQDRSVLASVWLLVLKNYTSPKQYLCNSDPYVDAKKFSEITANKTAWHVNFQSPQHLSYSFAYPYNPDGTTGAWWKNTTDSSLPIASDMAPLNGTGKPVRNVAPGAMPVDPHIWNSANHMGDGQNVGFADGHDEFVRRPDMGQNNDNIFTVSGVKGVSQFGGAQPGKSAIEIRTDAPPFDVVMVPARDLNTGGF